MGLLDWGRSPAEIDALNAFNNKTSPVTNRYMGEYTNGIPEFPSLKGSGVMPPSNTDYVGPASINLDPNVRIGDVGEFSYGTPNLTAPNQNFFASPEFANSLKALSAISGLGQTYLGMRGLSLAKDQFNLDKKISLANLNNNIKSYNTKLEFNLRDANRNNPDKMKQDLERLRLKA